MAGNPFKPTAGATPPLLVGRDDTLEEFAESLDDGPGAPARLALFTGPRGIGKTVMLTEVADHALRRGWVSLSETATPGMIDRLTQAASAALHGLDPATVPGRSITGGTLPIVGGGLSVSAPPVLSVAWRTEVGRLLDALERHDTGLLITVDEVHRAARSDLRDLAATVQHLIREDRNVALALAGLPSAISDLLNDDVLTFLRRATPFPLEDVPLDAVRAALHTTITDQGRTITDQALTAAANATGGYPFMIQLVGYHIWRKATGTSIDLDAVQAGIPAARKRLGSTVHATALADLSAVDRTYLLAMSHDDDQSSTSEIAARMRETRAYANVYRTRLIEAGIIQATGHGYVDFAIPYLREYLREHAAHHELDRRHR
ncbi:MAG: ATP-binding protein [Candidatus Nanopelagicales bacterium]